MSCKNIHVHVRIVKGWGSLLKYGQLYNEGVGMTLGALKQPSNSFILK